MSLTPLFKRLMDISLASLGIIALGWLIGAGFIIAWHDLGQFGLFVQLRVGRHGRVFKLLKLRTMRGVDPGGDGVTTSTNPRISRIGSFLRESKVDELPQLINVVVGHMSIVGPRPEVPLMASALNEEDRIILSVRPGITGPATLKYQNEEDLLATVDDPVKYNKQVLYPDKTRINKKYVENISITGDCLIIWKTILARCFVSHQKHGRMC